MRHNSSCEEIDSKYPPGRNPPGEDSNSRSYTDLPSVLIEQIAHFFEHYKDLEKGKWVKLVRWIDASEAEALINAAIKRYAATS